MINTKFLLAVTLLALSVVYYFIFPFNKIVNIVLDEYITIFVVFVLSIVYLNFKSKLKGKLLFEFIPNTNYVPIKSTVIFFLIFEVVDYYYEGGFVGMVKLWFSYWVFGVIAYLATHIINFYKNIKAYKESEIVTKL